MLRFLIVGWASLGIALGAECSFAAKGYSKLDEMSTDRWALLRETERYQLNIAEKYYLAAKSRRSDDAKRLDDFRIAADEYEKFLTLYESSAGASYVQLKWSTCQVQLKKLNTAIKDGYQTVIDYWPESPEAVAAAYLIGQTYKDMGDLGPAKQAYQKVLADYPDEMVAVLARFDLAEIARIEQNRPERIAALKELVFKSDRSGDAGKKIVEASQTLATLMFDDGAFVDGKDVLATSYKEPALSDVVRSLVVGSIGRLVAVADTKERGLKLADAVIAYFREQQGAQSADEAGRNRERQLTYHIASIHSEAGRPEEVVKLYESLVKANPGDDGVLLHYGNWLLGKNRHEEARSVYGRMKDQIEGQSHIASTYRDREENKPLLAVPIYEDLTTRDSEHADKWQMALADTYREAHKYQEAIGVYQQCRGTLASLQNMAGCYNALKQYREAIGLYTQIAAAYESSAPWALLQIGYTQGRAGQKEPAIATLQQVCRRFPKSPEASLAHQTLNKEYNVTFTLGGVKDE